MAYKKSVKGISIFFLISIISTCYLQELYAKKVFNIASSQAQELQFNKDSLKAEKYINDIKALRFSEPEKAKVYADSALTILRNLKLKSREVEVVNQLGIIASVQGDSPKALEYFLEVLRLREELGDAAGLARIQNNLGILYKNLSDYERSLRFHSLSLENKKVLNDSLGIARSLNNIGEIYQQKHDTMLARQYFEESLILMSELNFKPGLAALYNNLGEVYKLEGKIRKAIDFHSRSLELEKELDNLQGVGLSYLNIASLFLQIEQPEYAIENYLLAIEYFQRVNDLLGLKNAYNDLAITYADKENFSEAFKYFQLHSAIKDSVSSIETNRYIAELQTRYESEKQEQEIAFLNEKSIMQDKEIVQERNNRNLLLIITTLLLAIAVILYVVNRSKQKVNRILTQQKAELEEANRKIEEAAQLKVQFLSIMSHEIRTPMNAVVGMANLLLSDNPREDQKEYLDTLNFATKNLLSVVNDVLEYNKTESGKVELEYIEFNLTFLLSHIYKSFIDEANSKGIELRIDSDAKIPEVLKGDTTRLTQILNNLISNAIKFTEEGSVTVYTSLAGIINNEAMIDFKVSDTGIGISEDKLSNIFESFVQAGTDIHRRFGGSGLGLAIVKKLIELWGGSIKVVSSIGKGTTFSFSLSFPVSDSLYIKEVDPKEVYNQQGLKGVRVLLVEDDPVNVLVAKKFLSRWLAEVSICGNGEQALKELRSKEFDIVLMDLNMPVMDGYEASRKIRSSGKNGFSKIPILAITASNVFEEHRLAYEAGVNDIVPKPFDPIDLYNRVFGLIRNDEVGR